MRLVIKKHFYFLMALGIGLLVFFGPIFLAGKGFYYGDYKQQFYPWAATLHRSIRHFSLPLWVPEMGCGFPLLAEGQIGALYPPQWILFALFPFPLAYHAAFVFYFVFSGTFTYLFAKQLGVSREGAALAALIFLFSSSYAGMVFGLASLRTLAAFPLCLYCTGRFFDSSRVLSAAAGLSLSLGLAFLGGYFPWMPYLILGCALYFFYGLGRTKSPIRTKLGAFFLLSLLAGAGIAAAQLVPTFELVRFSARMNTPIEFALQKSFNPLNATTLLWPGFGSFLGFDFYIGILPFCLFAFASAAWREDRRILFLGVWTIVFMALALGRYNPFYTLGLKLTHFHFLRTPSKAMLFVSFSLAVLAGIGFDRWAALPEKTGGLFGRFAFKCFAVAAGVLLAANLGARFFGAQILAWAENYVRTHVAGKFGHPYSLETYLARLPESLSQIADRTSFMHPTHLKTAALWAGTLLLIFSAKRFQKRKTILFCGAAALILADLFFYMDLGSGFKGNAVRPETVAADTLISKITAERGLFRTYEYISDPVSGAPRWIPNTNLLFGYSSTGIYSPLVVDAYREVLKPIGGVDNASGYYPASQDSLKKNKEILDRLNVRYLISKEPLDGVAGLLPVLVSEQGDRLYENPGFSERALVVAPEDTNEIKGRAEVTEFSPMAVSVKAASDGDATLFLSELDYPGWKAFVDGKPAAIDRIDGVFRGVKIDAGNHKIRFVYRPFSFYAGVFISILFTLGCGACLFLKKWSPPSFAEDPGGAESRRSRRPAFIPGHGQGLLRRRIKMGSAVAWIAFVLGAYFKYFILAKWMSLGGPFR